MADSVDLSSLNKGISELNKNFSRLMGLNIFNNAKMNEMVSATNKIRDNFEDIDDYTNDIVKRSKEEELRLKALNALEKKRLDLKKIERDIEDKTNKIKKNGEELAERQKKLINRINKDEIEKTENLKKQTLELADQRKELKMHKAELESNLKTSEEQTKEFEKQLSIQKQQKTILSSLGSDFKRLGGNIKNLASGVVGKFLSAGMFIEGFKNLYEMSNKVYDSYWKLSVPLQKANTGMFALKAKTEEYSKALREVKFTAAKFGYDIDKIEPMISTLQDKVKYLKKDVGGKWEWDIESLADNAKQIISISKMMNMESDEMITMLEERVRRFGDTNEAALNSMHSMAAATLTFNEIMGQGSVFTEEVGKHLLELHQNTKYWVQDFGMLNTMFNSHVNLLLKQGKHQKEALALARQFQEGLQQPPELIKWKAGTRMLSDIKAKIKNLSDEQAAEQIRSMYGENVDAYAIVKAIRHSKNTGFTIANILQEMLGGTKGGTEATMGAWKSFMGFDSTVLKDMGLASSVSDAEKIKQLYKDLYKMGLGPSTTMEAAINKLVDTDKKLSDEEKEAKKKELKELINVNKGEAGKEPMSPFENGVLETMKDLKAWLDTPMVQIAGGALAGGAGIFRDTLSTLTGNLLSAALITSGGKMLSGGLRGIGSIGKGIGRTIVSSPGANLGKLSSVLETAKSNYAWNKEIAAKRAYIKKMGITGTYADEIMALERRGFGIPGSVKEFGGALRDTGRSTIRGVGQFGRGLIRSTGGGLAGLAVGALSGMLINENDERTGVTVNNVARSVSGVANGLALLNPIGLGVSAIVNLVKNENEGLSKLPNALGATFLSPVNDIVSGVGKIFGQTKKNNSLLAYLDDSMSLYTGTLKKQISYASASKEGQERLARAHTRNIYDKYDKELINLFGEKQISQLGITSSNLKELVDTGAIQIEDEATRSKVNNLISRISGSVGISERFGKYNIDALGEKKYLREAQESGAFKKLGFSGSRFGADNERMLRAIVGSTRAQQYREQINILKSEGYSDKEALEIVAHEIVSEKNELEKQRKILEDQRDFEKQMANYDKSIMENSNAQKTAMNVLAQKATIDMLRNREDYFDIKNGNATWKTYGDKLVIDGASSPIAALMASPLGG